LLLTNRGAIKREFTQNIEVSRRPAKGKLFLKNVKTNPYQFVGISSQNVFHLKDYLTFRIVTAKSVLTIPASDLKPDKFEHGAPYLEKDVVPLELYCDEQHRDEIDRIMTKLARDRMAEPEQPDLTPETLPAPVEPESGNVMLELEKIINTHAAEVAEDEEREAEEKEKIIQQTLF